MKTLLSKRLNELAEEAELLVKERSSLNQRFSEIEVRIAQIVGAMHEIDLILRSDENAQEENKQEDK